MFGQVFDYIFMSRSFWQEMNVPNMIVNQEYRKYFGVDEIIIDNRKEAIAYLGPIAGQLQDKFMKRLSEKNTKEFIKNLYKILDEVWHFYYSQKEARKELSKLKTSNNSIEDVFNINRNMARNVIDSVNLWLENALVHQKELSEPFDSETFEIESELFVDLYIYGSVSRALSLISMSKKFSDDVLFYGIHINLDFDEPLELLKYHPVIYFSDTLTGNQDSIQIGFEELKAASESEFGKGFKKEYGLDFLYSMRAISTIENDILYGGKCAFTYMSIACFKQWLEESVGKYVDPDRFIECFSITKENVSQHIRQGEPIVWIMGANKYRSEIRPLIVMEDGTIAISYAALEQSKQLWISIYMNGGMAYSTSKDALTIAIEKRNEELSDRLVDVIRDKLRSHYKSKFDEIDVQYDRIFGSKEINYGDYDIVFLSEDNELFLIEAKFFSDSLNNSGVISDYEKMFKKHGYYEHCRGRYDLVLQEPQKMKDFLQTDDEIKAHFLFISSKPLEIEFQDEDEVVTFPCLSIFDDYLEGKLFPEKGDEPIRPIHIL